MALTPDAWLVAPALSAGEGLRPVRHEDNHALPQETPSLEAIYAEHGRAIHRFLCGMLGDPVEAADATQETFARAFRRLDALRAADLPIPWLFGVARRVSLEVQRARRRKRRVIADAPAVLESEESCSERSSQRAPSPEDELLGREALRVVDGALSRLDENRRAILLLRLDHGLAYEEIAELMGWSIPKVKVEIHRARQVLRAELQTYDRGSR